MAKRTKAQVEKELQDMNAEFYPQSCEGNVELACDRWEQAIYIYWIDHFMPKGFEMTSADDVWGDVKLPEHRKADPIFEEMCVLYERMVKIPH